MLTFKTERSLMISKYIILVYTQFLKGKLNAVVDDALWY